MQRLQLRWPVKGGRVGGTHSRGRVEYEKLTGAGEQKHCTLCPVGYGHLFKCTRIVLSTSPLLTLHTYCTHATFINAVVISATSVARKLSFKRD